MSVTLNASTSSGLVQTADTSGTIELQSNGTTKLTVASSGVTANNLTATGTFGGGVITSGTAVTAATGSPTSIDFTSIPSWVKRITVMFTGVSTSGTSPIQLQLGTSSGVVATGYLGQINDTGTATLFSTGFQLYKTQASQAALFNGNQTFTFLTSNTWSGTGIFGRSDSAGTITIAYNAGSIALSATLDRVRITTNNGTDTFDAGTINILYEG